MKDQLFLLRPGFVNGDHGPYYCADCASVEGLLSFFPNLRKEVDVHYIDFQKPRFPVVRLIGPDHQSVPVLIVSNDNIVKDGSLSVNHGNGHRFIDKESEIRKYLSSQYGVASAA